MNNSPSRRLVKTIRVYDDGSTTERNYPGGYRPSQPVRELARIDESSIREFTRHYQAFLRVEKGSGSALTHREIFDQAVAILTRMLLLQKETTVITTHEIIL